MTEHMEEPFVKEPRYVVFKLKDIAAYLDDDDCSAIARIGEDIAMARRHDGKPPFNAVVVEQDWPEFDLVWAMIEARMTGKWFAGQMREMLRSMQGGEMTVSRGLELIDIWLAGNYRDELLPPVRDGLDEDETPWDRIDKLTSEIAELRARLPDVPKRDCECKTLEDWRCRAMYFESEWAGCSHGFNRQVGELQAELAALKQAAQSVIDRWDSPLWKDLPHTGEYIAKLREAVK